MLPARILIISADDTLTHPIITCLVQAKYKVTHTSYGQAGLELIRLENPRLVVLDINLTDFNSLAIIRALRSDELSHHIPVILVGSNMKEDDVLLSLEVGADLCLRDAFHPQVFIAHVRSLLRRTELVNTF